MTRPGKIKKLIECRKQERNAHHGNDVCEGKNERACSYRVIGIKSGYVQDDSNHLSKTTYGCKQIRPFAL